MSYAATIDRANPTAFMFLIDQSRSINQKMGGGESKAKFVGDVLNKTLLRLVTRCASADGVRDYFHIGVLAYNGTGAYSGFGGRLSSRPLHPISALAARPLRIEERKKHVPDGAGGLVDQSVKFPVWFEYVTDGDAPMCEGFRKTAESLVSWCNSHIKSYPPTIIHIAGGPSTDGDPEPLAEAVRHISTNHGQCLLFNLHVDSSEDASVIFPASEASLPDAYSKMLFRMSSLFPAHLVRPAQEKGYNASFESRFFGYRAGYEGLVNFIDIGTRISDLLLKESISPQSSQNSARPITESGTNHKSHQVNISSAAAPANPQPAEPAAGPRPVELASKTVVHERRPTWLLGIRMLGVAMGVIAAIVVFKLFVINSGPQPTQFPSQMQTFASKDDSASKSQSSDNGQSTGPSADSNVPAVASVSQPGAALLPDAKKIPASTDNAPTPAGGAEQPTVPVLAPMPPPKNIDQSMVAETSAVDTSGSTANIDLAKVPDAKRVQQKLIELGYLSGVADGVWGSKSKRALSEFRIAEKMGEDDQWDQGTEMKLFSTSTVRKQQNLAFVAAGLKTRRAARTLL